MKNLLKKKKGLIFSVLILVGFFVSPVSVAHSSFLSFGGKILYTTPCTCSVGSQVFIGGFPAIFTGTYLYVPGATLIRGKGNVLPSRLILGLYYPGGTCMVGKPPYCLSVPISKGTMFLIGTN